MDAKTYVKNVLITEARDFTPVVERMSKIVNVRLIHAGAGIASEIAELIEVNEKYVPFEEDEKYDRVNLMEELGDILWYLGIACDALNCVDEVTSDPGFSGVFMKHDDDLQLGVDGSISRLTSLVGNFIDKAVKKTVFYGKTVEYKDLVEHLRHIHQVVTYTLHHAGYTIEDARERNIAKLRVRYGDKFTEAAALNRDLETERKILENK